MRRERWLIRGLGKRVAPRAAVTQHAQDRRRRKKETDVAQKRGNVQYGALPYTLGTDGELRILLVTSRGTRRWIIPKGWPMKFRRPHQAAAQEALEEAGVVGKPQKRPIGDYQYDKLTDDGLSIRCTVTVFPLEVRSLDKSWKEAKERERQWFTRGEAAELVAEPELRALLQNYSPG
jgi:8-oxo-dGTP pyrophosphatase MutT (NUDIX family)